MADTQPIAPLASSPLSNHDDTRKTSKNEPSTDNTTYKKATAPSQPPRTPLCYPRRLLLFLSKSPLVYVPDDMPNFPDWFGSWDEPSKKDFDAGSTVRPRHRRDADELGDNPPREASSRALRAGFSQPAQMGSFRHQSSLQSLKLDTGLDKERERDRDGNERLRTLSDRYDRDRDRLRSAGDISSLSGLGSAPPRRDRDSTLSATNRQSSSSSLANGAPRRDSRLIDREPPASRLSGSATRTHERSATLSSKDFETRNDRSEDWRRDRWDDRGERPPRDRFDTRRSRSRQRDEVRGWETFRDDKDRLDKRSRSGERRSAWGDKERHRVPSGRGEEDRDRRKEEETVVVPLRNTRRERDRERDRDRDREKEPAWMEDWAPDPVPGKGMTLGTSNGEDKLQAWKKSMKEKDAPSAPTIDDLSPPEPKLNASSSGSVSPPEARDDILAPPKDADGLNDIERFKLSMKAQKDREQGNIPAPPQESAPPINGAPPGLTAPLAPSTTSSVVDPAIISQKTSQSSTPLPVDPAIITSSEVVNGLPTNGHAEAQLKSLGILGGDMFNPNAFKPLPSADANVFPGLPNAKADPRLISKPGSDLSLPSLIDPRAISKPNGQAVTKSESMDSIVSPIGSSISSGSKTNIAASMSLNLPSSGNAATVGSGGRQSKFAKFFQNQSTPKDETPPPMPPPPSSVNVNQHQMQQQQGSLGGTRDMANLGLFGGAQQLNAMMGNLRMSSPTHFSGGPQAQPPPPPQQQRMPSSNADPLMGLFANADRSGLNGLNLGGSSGAPTGGTLEGILAALNASARAEQAQNLPRNSGSRFGPTPPQQPMNKQQAQVSSFNNGPFGPPPGAFGGPPPDAFVADNLVPGLRPRFDVDERQFYGNPPPPPRQQTLYTNPPPPPRSVGGRPSPGPMGNQNLLLQNLQLNGTQNMRGGFPGGPPPPRDMMGMRTPQELAAMGLRSGPPSDYMGGGELGSAGLGGLRGPPGPTTPQDYGFPPTNGPHPSAYPNQFGPPPSARGNFAVPNVGAPGTADFALHNQQLQAARASAQAQQHAQMMANLGMRPQQPPVPPQQQFSAGSNVNINPNAEQFLQYILGNGGGRE